MLQDHKIHR